MHNEGADKTEHAYPAVGRRLLELRRNGAVPYDRISDGTRWVTRPRFYDDLEMPSQTLACDHSEVALHH